MNSTLKSKSRITDRHFKMTSISQARILERWKEYIIITYDTNQIFQGRFDNWDHREDILEEMYYTYSKISGRKYCHYFNNHYFTCNNKNISLMSLIIIMMLKNSNVKSKLEEKRRGNKWNSVHSIKF